MEDGMKYILLRIDKIIRFIYQNIWLQCIIYILFPVTYSSYNSKT